MMMMMMIIHYEHITLSLIWSQLKVGCQYLLHQKMTYKNFKYKVW